MIEAIKYDSSETMAALVEMNAFVANGEVLPESVTKAYDEEQLQASSETKALSLDSDIEQVIDRKMSTILSASKANQSIKRKARARVGTENDLKLISELGSGSFGKVVKMQHVSSGDIYAVKWINIENAARKRVSENDIMKEVRIIQSISHVNIARLYDYFSDSSNQNYLLLMELCEGRDLTAFITSETIPSKRLLSWLQQLVDGLVYLHEKGILHRDLKPDNIRVLPNDELKIIDFGLSRELSDAIRAATSVVGTSNYSSDEKVKGIAYDGRDDVWAVGCIFVEIIIGELSAFRLSDPSKGLQLADLLRRCHDRNPQVTKIVRQCLVIDYEARPSSAALLLMIEQERNRVESTNLSSSSKVRPMRISPTMVYHVRFGTVSKLMRNHKEL